jgi:hypothetical protein
MKRLTSLALIAGLALLAIPAFAQESKARCRPHVSALRIPGNPHELLHGEVCPKCGTTEHANSVSASSGLSIRLMCWPT